MIKKQYIIIFLYMKEVSMIPINKEIHKRLKLLCAEQGVMIKHMVEKLIEAELNKKGTEVPINSSIK